MSTEDDNKTPRSGTNEYHDHRRRAKERILPSPYAQLNNFDDFSHYGKAHQVQFKISPFVQRVGEETAALFNLSLSQYTKCLLYQNLGIFESIDRRRKARGKHGSS